MSDCKIDHVVQRQSISNIYINIHQVLGDAYHRSGIDPLTYEKCGDK